MPRFSGDAVNLFRNNILVYKTKDVKLNAHVFNFEGVSVGSYPSQLLGLLEALVMLLFVPYEASTSIMVNDAYLEHAKKNPYDCKPETVVDSEKINAFWKSNPRADFVNEAIPYLVIAATKIFSSKDILEAAGVEDDENFKDVLLRIYRAAKFFSYHYTGESNHKIDIETSMTPQARLRNENYRDLPEKYKSISNYHMALDSDDLKEIPITEEMTKRILTLFGIDLTQGAKAFSAFVPKDERKKLEASGFIEKKEETSENEQKMEQVLVPALFLFRVLVSVLGRYAGSVNIDWCFDAQFNEIEEFQSELEKQQYIRLLPETFYYAQQFCDKLLPMDQKHAFGGLFLHAATKLDVYVSYQIQFANARKDLTKFKPELRKERDEHAKKVDASLKPVNEL